MRLEDLVDAADPELGREAVRICAKQMVRGRDGLYAASDLREMCGVVADMLYRLLGEAEPADDGGC